MEEEETRQPSLCQWIKIGMERTQGANKSDFLFFGQACFFQLLLGYSTGQMAQAPYLTIGINLSISLFKESE